MAKKLLTDLRLTEATEDHLDRHGVTADEAIAVAFNGPRFFRDKEPGRMRMVGRSDEGRLLTIVVEEDHDESGTYDVITGWDATQAERTAWRREK